MKDLCQEQYKGIQDTVNDQGFVMHYREIKQSKRID